MKQFASFLAFLVAVTTFGACASHPAATPPPPAAKTKIPNWPNELDGLRFRWTAEPGIDLLTGPAVPLRAYLESYRVGYMTKTIDTVYPGFQRAVPEIPIPASSGSAAAEWNRLPFQLEWIRPAIDEHINFGNGPFYGNEYFHVLEIATTPDGYRAYVCDGSYNVFHPAVGNPGKYTSIEDYRSGSNSDAQKRERDALNVWRIEFSNKTKGLDKGTPQKGPNPAPIGDVFGRWRIDGAAMGNFWGPVDDSPTPQAPEYLQRLEQCSKAMPHNPQQRAQILMSVLDSAPVADPPVPGWPDTAA
ncbi:MULTISPECIES: hypothetical protein [Mycolicibacterium]|uniref:hypothetical protein n=1 Tax=Mycolicibacterium TaxID=1866885 RepID=UPI000A6B731F|nr:MULTISPECIES: hypothetical protein [Mycolicibacterium]MCX8555353.1 hypothetical protein [Mycolicibacterium mucogenicum]GCA98588.1 hypothetical protein NCCNTM_22230 [Mycolicibacterium sp. NCC-Tsukiji]